MCNYTTWHFDNNGYIIQCKECDHYQVCFGTSMLRLNQNNFDVLVNIVKTRYDNLMPVERDVKYIVLPTTTEDVNIIVSEAELLSLHTMLQNADNEIRAQQMLRLFTDASV